MVFKIYFFAIFMAPILALAQIEIQTEVLPVEDTLIVSNWKLKSIFGLNGTQSSYVNWNAGGRNNISMIGFISAQANYKKDSIKFDNDLNLALGGLRYTGPGLVGADRGFQKTDDRIDFANTMGYKLRKDLYLSLISSFKTQFLDGYAYPNDSVKVSTFMAPGYVGVGLGLEYSPNNDFFIFLSPLAIKMTFVQSQMLANAGAFGVTGATYDTIGNIVNPGKRFRGEFGASFKMKYNFNIAKNIDVKTKLELFSNYIENPQNIDVNAEIMWYFKINSWFSASLQWMMVYDDDIDVLNSSGKGGPRTQFKSVLGLGLSYTLKNFKED